jgi:uncharacterized membrane protein YkoI
MARFTGGWLALALLLCLSPAAFATDDHERPDHERAKILRQTGQILPLEKVLSAARSHHMGRVLEVELNYEEDHGGYVYEIKILDTNGEVWEVELEARTGNLIDAELEE